jgi:hygromycin-B 7''-O-kinase
MPLLPDEVSIHTRADLTTLFDPLRRALSVLAERHGLDLRDAAPASTGSAPVFLTDRWVIKLVPPQWQGEFDAELLATERVYGRLSVRTAGIQARGTIDAWGYAVFERLDGVSLRDARGSLSDGDRLRIAAQIGEALGSLHAVPTDGLAPLRIDWSAFALERTRLAGAFQARHGLSGPAVDGLPALFEQARPLVVDDRRALLHADLHHEHILLVQRDNRWNVHAIIDFGDAVVGHPEYELITPVFLAVGPHHDALLAFFSALGFRCDEQSATRLTAWSAMHRFNALSRFLPTLHGADALSLIRDLYWPRAVS